MKTKKKIAPWVWIAVLCVLGLLIRLGIPGYQFTAYILFGLAGVLLCYRLIAILKRRRPKMGSVFSVIVTIGLILGTVAAAVTAIPIAVAACGTPGPCQYVIVLGAGVNGTVPSLSLRNRLDAAYDYLIAYPEAICIVSGGQGPGEDISEAQCMYQDLTGKGIDPERIWMEDQSTSTRENLAFSLKLIEEKTGQRPKTAGVLSSEYHIFRAGMVAREQNLEAVGIPAKTSWVSLRINYFLREIAGVWYYMIFGG